MPDAFDRIEGVDQGDGDAFDKFPLVDESFEKSSVRTALQVPQGVAEFTTPGIAASIFQFLAAGETDLGVEEFQRLRAISEREGKPFNEQGYEDARQQLLRNIPTVSNLARIAEEKTGIPLEAKTELQNLVRLASSAGKAAPGTLVQKATASAAAPIISTGLQSVGVPEGISNLAGLAISPAAALKTPPINIGAAKKPSGLTTQRFEKITKPTEVSEKTIGKINTRLENEFRTLSDEIIGKSPVKETYENLKNDFSFKQKSAEGFEEVSKLAESYPNKYKTSDLTKKLSENAITKKNKGITPSEFDKKHNIFIQEFVKDSKKGDFTTAELVSQYRKNNKSLGEAFEPGQSFAYNNAKREALLDYNKTISEIIEKEHPNSEFSNLFKDTNQRWTEISDAEAIGKFVDGLFEGKVQYQKGRQFFDKQGMTVPFKRALGKDGFAKFETLVSDLMSTEQASKLLRQAKAQGFGDLAKHAAYYFIHPYAGSVKSGLSIAKSAGKSAYEYLLDKPQLAVTWDRGLNAMKKGDFKVAEIEFGKLDKELNPKLLEAKKEALKQFKEKSI